MSTKLPLSSRTHLVLKSSIMSMITRGSSFGYLTPRASSFENTIPKLCLLRCLDGRIAWTLFTCLCCDFIRDLNDPPTMGLLFIILISSMASLR